MSASTTDLTVANTILGQLGGSGLLTMMVGAKGFCGDANSVSFSIGSGAKGGINKVVVRLDPCDTYTVQFWKFNRRTFECTMLAEVSDVYNDSLMDVFERHTGFYLTFASR